MACAFWQAAPVLAGQCRARKVWLVHAWAWAVKASIVQKGTCGVGDEAYPDQTSMRCASSFAWNRTATILKPSLCLPAGCDNDVCVLKVCL